MLVISREIEKNAPGIVWVRVDVYKANIKVMKNNKFYSKYVKYMIKSNLLINPYS